MKTSGGFFKDKAVVGINTITGDHVDVAILKVSSTDVEVPKEKYVNCLIHMIKFGYRGKQTKNGKPIQEYIVSELTKRVHSHNWIVVLKSLIVLHRLCREAPSPQLANCFVRKDTFNYMKIKNVEKSLSGSQQKLFIIQYVDYLRRLGRIMPSQLSSDYTLLDVVDLRSDDGNLLLNAAEQLTEIAFREETLDNYITLQAFRLLVQDGVNLSTHIKLGLSLIAEIPSEGVNTQLANKDLRLYQRGSEAMVALRNYFSTIKHSPVLLGAEVPQLEAPPSMERVLERLQDVQEFPSRRNSSGSPVQKSSPTLPRDARRRSSDALQTESTRIQPDDDEDAILQKVLRLSRIEAGLPEEDLPITSSKLPIAPQPLQPFPLAEQPTSAPEPSQGAFPTSQGPPSPPTGTGEEKPASPNFSLDDLFVEDTPAKPVILPAQETYQPFGFMAAPPAFSSGTLPVLPSAGTAMVPAPLPTVGAHPGFLNPYAIGNPPLVEPSGEWETGVPTAPLDTSLLPSHADCAVPGDSGNWDTGAPSTFTPQGHLIPSQDQWNGSTPAAPFTGDPSFQTFPVQGGSQNIQGNQGFPSPSEATFPDPYSTVHQDPFKLLYLNAANTKQ